MNLPDDRQGSDARAVELAARAGLLLDDWQRWLLTESLRRQRNDQWSAFEVAVLVGRQNGKGSILEARQLAGLFLLGERLQVHTAHEFKTCYEHFLRVVQLIEGAPVLDKQVQRVRRGAGEQAIELRNGQRLRFLARSGGSGRGMSGDTIYLDEAFALTPAMLGALLPTLSARPNPQVWYTSSAPMTTSGVLHGLRKRSGDGGRLLLAEWGNEQGVDPNDLEAWYRANPALGIRITEEFVHAEMSAMSAAPGEFCRERLGVPDPPLDEARPVKLPAEAWAATGISASAAARFEDRVFAFDVSLDGAWSSVASAGGSLQAPYVEVFEHKQGVGWLPARLAELAMKHPEVMFVCNGAGPAGAQVGPVLAAFADAQVPLERLKQLSAVEYKQACGGFYTDVVEGRLKRPAEGQGPLDIAAGDATERTLGDAWAWDIRSATVPISPLVAVTLARALLPFDDPLPAIY